MLLLPGLISHHESTEKRGKIMMDSLEGYFWQMANCTER